MNMSECSGAAMLLTKGDSVQRKKRAYCDVALQEIRDEQQQSYYGKRVERNVAKVSLPKVGTLIKMTEVMQFVRAHAWDKPAKQGYILVPYPHSARSTWSMSGTSSRDEEKVYEVVGYTGDTTNPFNSSLKMIFRNVYPESNYVREQSVPTKLIACGHIRYTEISSKDIMQLSVHAEKDVDEN